MTSFISLDFEYRNSQEALLELVSVAIETDKGSTSMWLHRDKAAQKKLKDWLLSKRDTHTLLCWSYDAEGRSLISLGINPAKYPCIDLQAEYKMLTNHNDSMGYGRQLIDGKQVTTCRKTYEMRWLKNSNKRHDRTPTNLLAATYKLLGIFSSYDYSNKNKMRCLLYTSPSPRDATLSRMPSSA